MTWFLTVMRGRSLSWRCLLPLPPLVPSMWMQVFSTGQLM